MNVTYQKFSTTYFIRFLIMFIFFFASASASVEALEEDFLNQEIRMNVFFKDKIDHALVEKYDGVVLNEFDSLHSVSLLMSYHNMKDFLSHPSVLSIEQDVPVKPVGQTTDWGIHTTNTPQAWQSNLTGKGIKVGVLDTGVSTSHPDIQLAGGKSFVSYTSSYNDDHGHGTHVAGVIGAKNNDFGVVGAAPDAEMYALKVMGSNGSGYLSDIAAGIHWAVDNKMDIINLSLGTTYDSPILQDAVKRAASANVLIIGAAGNSSTDVFYPAKYPEVIAISATDQNNNLASFSNRGPEIELASPGVAIYSAYKGQGYTTMSGTSMAAPYVAGIAALYMEKNQNDTAASIRLTLQQSAKDIGTTGKDSFYGFGLIQAPTGSSSPQPQPQPEPTKPPSDPFRVTDVTTSSVTLAWNEVSSVKKYVVKRGSKTIYSGTDTSFVDENLLSDRSYKYQLLILTTSGERSAYTVTVRTKASIPSAPSFTKTNGTYRQVSLKWKSIYNATSYTITRNGTIVYQGKKTSWTDTFVSPQTSYTYSIEAQNALGKSQPTSTTVTTKMAPPTALKNTTVTAKSNAVTLSWEQLPNASFYIVKRGSKVLYKGTNLSFTDTKIIPGTTYKYTIYAQNESGAGMKTTLSASVPQVKPAAVSMKKEKKASSYHYLKWNKIQNARSYAVYRNGVKIYEGKKIYLYDRNIKQNTVYQYKIVAINEKGTSNPTTVSITSL